MGRLLLIIFSTILLLLSTAINAKHKPKKSPTFLLPVTKNDATNLYQTSIGVGTRNINNKSNDLSFSLNLNIDLTGRTLWFYCDGFNSVTYHAFRCGTSECQQASYDFCIDCDGPFPPGCSHYQCGKYIRNWLVVKDNNTSLLIDFFFTSQLGRDVFFLSSALDGVVVKTPLIFSCGEERALQSLPNSTAVGAIGLANLNLSIPSQLASRYNFPWKFALCLPSKAGLVGGLYIGGGPYFLPPYTEDLSKIFVSTPLVTNSLSMNDPVYERSSEYFIGVESIQIDGKALSLNKTLLVIEPKFGNGGTKISTLTPYTVLHTSIYKTLLKTFAAKAKMARAPAIAPFGACYSSRGLGGSAVPIIDLVLKGGGKWRIYASNSLVKVKRDVVCLAFVDGGEGPAAMASIVIGGHLLEDNLIEFDVRSSKISFTSSLLVHNTSCSNFKP